MNHRLKHNSKRLPFGGHHFRENGVTLKGDTFQDVVDLLTDFRLMNGWPIGNPPQEIINYYAEKFPWMVEYDVSGRESEPVNEAYVEWRDWISSVWGKHQNKFLTRKEASFRWDICKTCPHNVGTPWKETKESIEFSRKSLLLKRGEKVPDNYCFCSLHRADISVSSFLESPQELSRKDQNKSNHPGCWF